MLKRSITFEDFNGEKQTEEFYFNLSKAELLELEFEVEGGMGDALTEIIKAKDAKGIIFHFKRLVLAAYGEKSPDGRRFIKNDEMREAFSQTAAYQELFMELATDDKAGAEFVRGIMPAEFAEQIDQELIKKQTAEALNTVDVAKVKTTAELAAEQAPIETTEAP